MQKIVAIQFALSSPESALGRYRNRGFSKHFFWKICGGHYFTRTTRENESSVAV